MQKLQKKCKIIKIFHKIKSKKLRAKNIKNYIIIYRKNMA